MFRASVMNVQKAFLKYGTSSSTEVGRKLIRALEQDTTIVVHPLNLENLKNDSASGKLLGVLSFLIKILKKMVWNLEKLGGF